jgi:hypothetical protein
LLVAVAFAGGLAVARPLSAGRFDPYRKLAIFSKVLSYIENNYVEDISESDLMYGAARGLTDVLDPHSRFMDPDEYERLRKETEGDSEITGIGIDLEKRKRGLVVVSPIEGSPAARAGIEPGDLIRKIDGPDASNLEWEDAINRIQGPAGSEVVLVVERRARELTMRIRRERFEVKSVEGRVLEDGYGYVKLRVFSSNTDAKLLEALEDIKARTDKTGGLKGLILDMRRNPGGCWTRGEGGRSLPHRGADREDRRQGRAGDGPADGPLARHLGRLPDGGARGRRDRVGGRDRGRGAAGPPARRGDGDPDLRQGLGADGDDHRGLRAQALRAEADGVALLHPQRAIDPDPGHHPQRGRRGHPAARPTPPRPRSCASATTSGHLRNEQGRASRPSTSDWPTTSCRWRWTT